MGAAQCHVRILRLPRVSQCGRLASFCGGVATLDGGSTDGGELLQAQQKWMVLRFALSISSAVLLALLAPITDSRTISKALSASHAVLPKGHDAPSPALLPLSRGLREYASRVCACAATPADGGGLLQAQQKWMVLRLALSISSAVLLALLALITDSRTISKALSASHAVLPKGHE